MRWLPVGLASQKPECLLPNEERVSRGLSGEKAAGLYKQAAGRSLALRSLCESRRRVSSAR